MSGRPIVVGLLGRAGSGKSTASRYLADRFDAQTHSFARPLKKLARELFDLTEAQVFGSQVDKESVDERYGVSPRTLLIRLGEGARRWIGPRVWADACLNGVLESYAAGATGLHVIEDVRHINEAEILKSDPRIHGCVIKLEYGDRPSLAEFDSAPSEASVDQVPVELIDVVIRHTTTDDAVDLKRQVERAVVDFAGPLLVQV